MFIHNLCIFNYRPLAGIYSSSGSNAESLARIDLILITLKKEDICDYRHAKLNAWLIQLEFIQLSSRYQLNPSINIEISYQAYIHFRKRSQNVQFSSDVTIPGYDSSWLYSFSISLDLVRCSNSNVSNSRDVCLNSMIADFADIISGISQTANYPIIGKPLIYVYISTQEIFTPSFNQYRLFSTKNKS